MIDPDRGDRGRRVRVISTGAEGTLSSWSNWFCHVSLGNHDADSAHHREDLEWVTDQQQEV